MGQSTVLESRSRATPGSDGSVSVKGTKGYQRVPKGTKGYQRVPKGTKGYQRVPKGTKGYQRVPGLRSMNRDFSSYILIGGRVSLEERSDGRDYGFTRRGGHPAP